VCSRSRRNKFESRGRAGAYEKFFVVVPLHIFGSVNTISRFDERFRDGQYRLVICFFAVLLLMVLPPYPAICKGDQGRNVTAWRPGANTA